MKNEQDLKKEEEEIILQNIERGLLPCGCERSKCLCKLSGFDYVIKYRKFLGMTVKHNTGFLKENKGKIVKESGKNIKDAWKFLKSNK